MKTLTIKQPYASLIVNGYKKYEFRSWKTNYRGKILIHAGKTTDKNAGKMMKKYNLDYQNGAIIGEAYITDCILVDEKFNSVLFKENPFIYGNNHIGNYAFKLERFKRYKKPIFIKGKLGLWDYKK